MELLIEEALKLLATKLWSLCTLAVDVRKYLFEKLWCSIRWSKKKIATLVERCSVKEAGLNQVSPIGKGNIYIAWKTMLPRFSNACSFAKDCISLHASSE